VAARSSASSQVALRKWVKGFAGSIATLIGLVLVTAREPG